MTRAVVSLTVSYLALGFVAPVLAQESSIDTEQYQLEVETIAEGLEHPWAVALLPDGRVLVTERNAGNLRLVDADGSLSEPIEGVPDIFRYEGETERSQGGLFDVKLHPEFAENNTIYLSYSKPTDHGAAVAIDSAELILDDGEPRLDSVESLFTMKEEDQDSSGLHFGGRMAIHPEDGSIFLTIGDRRNISRAQDGEDQAGSILRMTAEGEPAEDNPFLDDESVDDYIYSMGHRNPQGMAFDPDTLELWINDHGPEGGDELNVIEAGNNYGWPFITGGVDYSGAPIGVGLEKDGMVSPVHVFEETVAPSGLAFVTGEMFPEWQGDMLHGGLVTEGLVRTRIEDMDVVDEEVIEIGRRIRDVAVAEDGSLYVVTEHEDGEVLRLTAAQD